MTSDNFFISINLNSFLFLDHNNRVEILVAVMYLLNMMTQLNFTYFSDLLQVEAKTLNELNCDLNEQCNISETWTLNGNVIVFVL